MFGITDFKYGEGERTQFNEIFQRRLQNIFPPLLRSAPMPQIISITEPRLR
jgi:hypothetical protein